MDSVNPAPPSEPKGTLESARARNTLSGEPHTGYSPAKQPSTEKHVAGFDFSNYFWNRRELFIRWRHWQTKL